MVQSYIVEGVGGNGPLGYAIDLHIGDLIVPMCSYGESLACALVDRQSSFRGDCAIASRGCRDGIR